MVVVVAVVVSRRSMAATRLSRLYPPPLGLPYPRRPDRPFIQRGRRPDEFFERDAGRGNPPRTDVVWRGLNGVRMDERRGGGGRF